MHDRDDLAAEQAERELRHKLKQGFKGFCEKVEQVTKGALEFDSPFRDLGFNVSRTFHFTCLIRNIGVNLTTVTDYNRYPIFQTKRMKI